MASKNTLLSGVNALNQQVDKLIGKMGNAAANMSDSSGKISTGSNFLNNALGSFSSSASVRAVSRMGAVGGVAQGAFNAAGGFMNMLPDVQGTMQRAGTYYNAAIRVPGMGRAQLQQMTLGAMQGGITSVGSDADTANYLAMRGMMPKASFGSAYQETLRNVSNSAKYLNMDNVSSARAIEGLTSGQGSSNMMRRFGIQTADPRTGEVYTEEQIFRQLKGRLTAGRGKATVEETNESLRRGALGNTLRNSGLSEDQQYRMSQMFLLDAAGKPTDLSDPNAMKGLEDPNNKNPFASGYKLNTAKTNAMQDNESAYVAGVEGATEALIALTNAASGASQALGGAPSVLNAFGNTFGSDPVGQGFGSVLGGAGSMIGNIGVLAMANKAGMNVPGMIGLGGGGVPATGGPIYDPRAQRYRDPKTGKFVKTPANANAAIGKGTKGFNLGKSVGKGLGKGFGLGAVASIGGTILGDVIAGDAAAGSDQSKIGGAISGAASGAGMGAMIGSFIPGVGTAIGAVAGGLIGGIAGWAGGGDTTNSKGTDSGAPSKLSMIHPITPAKITAKFGQKEYGGQVLWPNGHNGVDYSATMGQTIFAAADGVVHKVSSAGELGNHVVIKHDSGHYTFYCHLSSTSVSSGPIKQGTPVGGAGKTGRATGVHLHFALSTSASTGNSIDPAPYMTGAATDDTYSAKQQSDGSTPNAQGATSGNGKEDEASTGSSAGSILSVDSSGYSAASGASGMSNASGLKAWSSSSVTTTAAGSGASNPDQPTGGDGYVGPDGGDSGSSNPITVAMRKARRGSTFGGSGGGSSNTNVTINLTVAKANDEEMRKFSRMLKQALEENRQMSGLKGN